MNVMGFTKNIIIKIAVVTVSAGVMLQVCCNIIHVLANGDGCCCLVVVLVMRVENNVVTQLW